MAIVAIDAIVDLGYCYGCLKKLLDHRIAASEADFVEIFFLYKFWKSFVYFGSKWHSKASTNKSRRTTKIYMLFIQVYENGKTPSPPELSLNILVKLVDCAVCYDIIRWWR